VSAIETGGQTPVAPHRPRMPQQATRCKFWGWGLEGEGFTASEIEQLGGTFAGRWGIDAVRVLEPPRVAELGLRAPRLAPPASLEAAGGPDG
jgi:alkyldihydroxyacetonephosphate synthase